MNRACAWACSLLLPACGDPIAPPGGGDGGPPGADAGDHPAWDGGSVPIVIDGGPEVCATCVDDPLTTALGCAGVYNPDQVLDLRLEMAAGDWSALKADTTNAILFPATFQCGAEPPLPFPIGVRRKRSGGIDKPGLKVDFNGFTAGGHYQTLKKLSLENGVSEGTLENAAAKDLLAEYAAWRLMILSGAHASRAVFARVHVNGALIGAYVNVEQVDKRFLRTRLGDDAGWLYKLSGSVGDGYKTNETLPNPYAAAMCFWDKSPCAPPTAAELETYLPAHLDIPQMLRFGGVNALLGNADAPIYKDNNFYWYDGGGPRVYFPWDLDTTLKDTPTIFSTPFTTLYTSVLFTHWEDDYDVLMTSLLAGPLALDVIHGELDAVLAVAGDSLAADPAVTGDAGSAVAELKTWWTARHAAVSAELAGHAP
jgi:hypothetical protein